MIYDLRFKSKGAALMLALLMAVQPVWADLVATVSPGYIFSPGENPSTDTLNLLGEPTILISGTVSGTTGLTAGSVTGTLLADGLPDGVYLTWNTAGPRQLTLLNGGLPLAGDGLQGNNTNLFVLADPNFFRLATNSIGNTNSNTGSVTKNWLTLSPSNNVIPLASVKLTTTDTNSANTNAGVQFVGYAFVAQSESNNVSSTQTNNGVTLDLRQFTSALTAIPSANGSVLVAHGLIHPTQLRVVAVNTSATPENGYSTNDEVGIEGFLYTSTGNQLKVFTQDVDPTNVNISAANYAGNILISPKTGGNPSSITIANWKLKIYARP